MCKLVFYIFCFNIEGTKMLFLIFCIFTKAYVIEKKQELIRIQYPATYIDTFQVKKCLFISKHQLQNTLEIRLNDIWICCSYIM